MTDAAILDIGCSTGLHHRRDRATRSPRRRRGCRHGLTRLCDPSRGPCAVRRSIGRAPAVRRWVVRAVVCNHVYEHVPDAAALMRDVHRVLRSDGVCYFAAGHTLQLIEPHYRVPFLSWFRVPWPVWCCARRERETVTTSDSCRRGASANSSRRSRADFISPRMLARPESN